MVERELLLVEGPTEEKVVPHFIRKSQIPTLLTVKPHGGIDRLLKQIPILLKPGTDLERLGIVVDADNSAQAGWQSIRDRLKNSGFTNVPKYPDPAGTIVEQDGFPRVGVWIMPDNRSPGMLEDYLQVLVPSGDRLLSYAQTCVDKIPEEDRRFGDSRLPKALIHTWLAWQKKPGLPLWHAMLKGYFDIDSPKATDFIAWLNCVFHLPINNP